MRKTHPRRVPRTRIAAPVEAARTTYMLHMRRQFLLNEREQLLSRMASVDDELRSIDQRLHEAGVILGLHEAHPPAQSVREEEEDDGEGFSFRY